MAKIKRRFSIRRMGRKAGAAPGSLVHVGEKKAEKTRLTLIQYDIENFSEAEVAIEKALQEPPKAGVHWINLDGLHDISLIEQLGNAFGIHPLTQEDILHTSQRPKLEEFENYIFLTLRMLHSEEHLDDEQISLIFGKGFVISFQERVGDSLEPVRERLRQGRPRIRSRGADYLTYALVDTIVDHYFLLLEKVGDELESLGEELVRQTKEDMVERIYNLRTRMATIRRAVWPLRELVSRFERLESELVDPGTRVFLRDVYDHSVQLIDVVETFREMTSSMIDLYLSVTSNRMNEVMKVLTVVASIFIPLTFLAGIYGMNFEYMPELHFQWGYFAVWAMMIVIGVGMFIFFKTKKWL